MFIFVKLFGVKECGFCFCNVKINFFCKIIGFFIFDLMEFC